MCLIFLANRAFPSHPFVLAFNRDEVYERQTAAAHWWQDAPHVIGGRDKERGGTWGGVHRSGRFAFLTFWRQGPSRRSEKSRGLIVADFLRSESPVAEYVERLRAEKQSYLGYNVLLGSVTGAVHHYSNVTDALTQLLPGVHGLSNANINAPWPKVTRGKDKMSRLAEQGFPDKSAIFAMMADRTAPSPEELPDTGIGEVREKVLAPMFIVSSDYGTRSTTIVTCDSNGRAELTERTHDTMTGGVVDLSYEWAIG